MLYCCPHMATVGVKGLTLCHQFVLCCCSCAAGAEQRSSPTNFSDDDGGDVGPVVVQWYRRLSRLLQRPGAAGQHGPVADRGRRPVHGRRGARARASHCLRRASPIQVGRRRTAQQLLRHRLYQQTQSRSADPHCLYLSVLV